MKKILILLFLILTTILNANSYDIVDIFDENNKSKKENRYTKKSYKKRVTKKTKDSKIIKTNTQKSRAKLVIIIDDVTHSSQLRKIEKLPFKVTPSIFPPNISNKNSHLLAKNLKHYLVHLPLESGSKQMNKMHKTIFRSYSANQINNRIKEIRRLFPTAKYINNHTGSKFTSNYNASKKLYKALLDNGFIFVDSRTTELTKIPKISREFSKRYLKSDIFIDNKLNIKLIKKQIKKGVKLAKKRGYAVIIGHPHKETLRALKESKKLLNSVNTVYIDEL